MHKKGLKFAPVVKLAKLNFTYLYHSTKIAKARPGFDDWPEYPSVQINSSSPWSYSRDSATNSEANHEKNHEKKIMKNYNS